MGRLSENSVVSIKNKSFSVTAEVDVADGGANGVIIAQGGRFSGKIHWVQLDLGSDDHDHFIDPEERLRIAMARQ
jgi:hypothetical protein